MSKFYNVLCGKQILSDILKNGPLFNLFSVFFKQTIQFLQQINVKNVYPAYCAGIWTHDPCNIVSSHNHQNRACALNDILLLACEKYEIIGNLRAVEVGCQQVVSILAV